VSAIGARKSAKVVETVIHSDLRNSHAVRAAPMQIMIHGCKATRENILARRHLQFAPKYSLELAQAGCGILAYLTD
jgi:hypothetical protein